ncbi:hypothetical protein AWW66_13680 [Micromonospora rosaria]|uniref:Pyrrolo-quinoline quinone n=1 Tax=Micromonospora rosaria TaxID=47874 RepID=A0A136PSV9_9ACTN|nr:hypothetical protein [Micromonospora rosaria]KXK61445.1 hypothetical protein AWW66_13680 [Micromonospora rosaria]
MTIIDLGEVRRDAPPPPATGRPRPPRRGLWSVLVLVLVCATPAASGPLEQRAAATLPATVGATASLVDDRLFVLERQGAETGGTPRLTAWALPTAGRPGAGLDKLWEASVPGLVRLLDVEVRDGLVIASGVDESSGGTVVLDAATGDRHWRQPGTGSLTTGGNLLLSSGRGAAGEARVVEVATGRPIWVLPTRPDGVALVTRDGRIDRMVLTAPGGRIEVRSADTGAVLGRVTVAADPTARPYVSVVDDLVLVSQGATATVTAYGLDRLDVRWTGFFPRVEYFVSCGPTMLCAFQRNRPMSGVERGTGRTRWQTDGWWVWRDQGERLLVLAATGGQTGELGTYGVLDAVTGRVLGRVGVWDAARSRSGRPGNPVLVRPAGERGLLVAELDVETAQVRLLDVLPGADRDCQVEAGRLLCRTRDGFGVWPLRH